jgi:hypothetical protein
MAVATHINDTHCASGRTLGRGEEGLEEQSCEQVVGEVVCLKLDFEPLLCLAILGAHNLHPRQAIVEKERGARTPALLTKMWSLGSFLISR